MTQVAEGLAKLSDLTKVVGAFVHQPSPPGVDDRVVAPVRRQRPRRFGQHGGPGVGTGVGRHLSSLGCERRYRRMTEGANKKAF